MATSILSKKFMILPAVIQQQAVLLLILTAYLSEEKCNLGVLSISGLVGLGIGVG
jgi:hypothetical protein